MNVEEGVERSTDDEHGAVPLPVWEMAALFALGTTFFVLVPDPLWRAGRDESHLFRFVFSYFAIVPLAAWRLRHRHALSVASLATVVGVVWAGKLLATVPLYHLFAPSRRPDVHAPEVAATSSIAPTATSHFVEGSAGVAVVGRVVDASGSGVTGTVVALCDEGLTADAHLSDRDLTLRGDGVQPPLIDATHEDTLVIGAGDATNHVLRGVRDGVTAFSLPVVAHAKSRETVLQIGSMSLEVDGKPVGWLFVFDHPWHTRTAADGRFALGDTPLGAHRLCVFGASPRPLLARDVVIPQTGLDLTLALEGSPS